MANNKQTKIINKIKYKSGQTTPLGTKKNDEFYTSLQTITEELSNYNKELFCNFSGLSPFDWDLFDEFPEIHGLTLTFNKNGGVDECFLYKGNLQNEPELMDESAIFKYNKAENKFEINGKILSGPRCNFLKAVITFAPEWKIKKWTFSGYNSAIGRGIDAFKYNFDEYDLIITNPPFSLMRLFLDKVVNEKVNLISLTAFINRVNPCVGLKLWKKELYLGYGRHKSIEFENWDLNKMELNIKKKKVACDWITTFDENVYEKHNNGFLTKNYIGEYEKIKSIIMKDNSNPIWIKHVGILPDDYYDWFFSSIGLFDKFNPDDFEWYGTNYKKFFNTTKPERNPCKHKFTNKMVPRFHGILARRRRK